MVRPFTKTGHKIGPIDFDSSPMWPRMKKLMKMSGLHKIICWPRRHGKTLMAATVAYWKFMTGRNELLAFAAVTISNNELTVWGWMEVMIRHTPYSRMLLNKGMIIIKKDEMSFPALGNKCKKLSGTGVDRNWGSSWTGIFYTEGHTEKNIESYKAARGGMTSTPGAMSFMDSTVGHRGGLFNKYLQLGGYGEDIDWLQYQDEEEMYEKMPWWITKEQVRMEWGSAGVDDAYRRKYLLNTLSDADDLVIDPKVLENYIVDKFPQRERRNNAKLCVGVDMAQSYSKSDAQTACTAIQMFPTYSGPQYHILESKDTDKETGITNTTTFIQKYRPEITGIERPESSELFTWCSESHYDPISYSVDKVSKPEAVLFARRMILEGRVLFHREQCRQLIEQLSYFIRIENPQTGYARYTGKEEGKQDDCVMSMVWGMWRMRDAGSGITVRCHQKDPRISSQCLLKSRDGTWIPHLCKDECRTVYANKETIDSFKDQNGNTDWQRLKDHVNRFRHDNLENYPAANKVIRNI